MTNPLLAAALTYATHGWAVLPCHTPTPTGCSCQQPDCTAPGKHPRTTHGTRDATDQPDLIARWWQRWPTASVAIATGQRSGLLVVDLDPRHGANTSWTALTTTHHPPEPGPTVLTGNGAHLYFAHPGGPIPNSVNRIGPGIDIRSDGGYVLAPPSLHHTNHRYRWLQPADQQLQAAPHWLLTRCQPPTPRTVSEPIVLRDSLHAWALAAMHGETDRVRNAVAGTRNTTLSTAAFRLGQLCATGHLDPTHVTAQLLDAAHHAGLTPNEAQRTITSGLNAGHHHPRQHLPTH